MADFIGSKDAVVITACTKVRLLRRIPAIRPFFGGKPRLHIQSHATRVPIIDIYVGHLTKVRNQPLGVAMVHGHAWRYKVSGIPQAGGLALCVALARELGDLEKTAALTALMGLPPQFAEVPDLLKLLGV